MVVRKGRKEPVPLKVVLDSVLKNLSLEGVRRHLIEREGKGLKPLVSERRNDAKAR